MTARVRPHARGSGRPHTTETDAPLLDITTEQHLRINRRYQRIETSLPCEVGLPGENMSAVSLLNLSVGGLKFECGLQQINSLLPEEQRTPGMVMDVALDVRLKLKSGGGRVPNFNGKARLAHYERLAQDRFHVGVEFVDIEKAQRHKLEDFINDTLTEAASALADSATE
jgi:hypothetical protein